MPNAKTLIVLSGPSGVGKDPMVGAVRLFHPELKYAKIPVYKSIESRPGGKLREDDDPRLFMPAKEFGGLGAEYVVENCRRYPQAIRIDSITNAEESLFFIEIYHTIGAKLMGMVSDLGFDVYSVFMSPFSEKDLRSVKEEGLSLERYITSAMARKQVVRSVSQGKDVHDPRVIADNLERACDAYDEMRSAPFYSHVIVNHDQEGHPNWNRLLDGRYTARPVGDAGMSVNSLAEILQKGYAANPVRFDKGIFV